MTDLPAPIVSLIDDFGFLDDWEDRYRMVLDLGKELAPLSEDERNDATKVEGCVSQVWLVKEPAGETLTYRGDSDSHIVRGLIAILLMAYSGRTAQQILDTDIEEIFRQLGLVEHLTPQRANGLRAMVGRIRADAAAILA